MKPSFSKNAALAAVALTAMSLVAQPLPATAATDAQAAYEAALAAGTPAALRDFILEHRDNPLVEQAFNRLNILCVESGNEDGCNLDDLVLPAAGPTPTSTTPGPSNEGGTNENASPV